jgi:hypothetical protein
MEEKLQKLKLKKAVLMDQMSMLSSVDDHFYLQLGKLEAQIINMEKQIVRETKNTLDEN